METCTITFIPEMPVKYSTYQSMDDKYLPLRYRAQKDFQVASTGPKCDESLASEGPENKKEHRLMSKLIKKMARLKRT